MQAQRHNQSCVCVCISILKPRDVFADSCSTLAKHVNREVETDAVESLVIQWLQLMPLLIQACAQLPHPSAFLYDVFQVRLRCALCFGFPGRPCNLS